VISDRDVWQAALLIVKRYGDDAMLEASELADQLLDEGDMAGAETWHRILNAIGRLQAKVPVGERCNDCPARPRRQRTRPQQRNENRSPQMGGVSQWRVPYASSE
jgi:hypothetical protein